MKTIGSKIHFLYTNIGRGHPFYLDGIHEELIREGHTALIRSRTDVFEVSTDVARWAWLVARWLYTSGSSSEGAVGNLYRKLRTNSDYNTDSLALRIMGRDIRRTYMSTTDPVVVAHPILVAALRGRKNVYYQHGEAVTPKEAVVEEATAVFVPTESAAAPFISHGYSKEQVIITGLCIEAALARQAKDAFDTRLQRMRSDAPLTGAFFSSGAEPQEHIHSLLAALDSILSVGHQAIVFASVGGKLSRSVREGFAGHPDGFAVVDHQGLFRREQPQLVLVEFRNRRELNILTAQFFPEFDFVVSPAHERTNWGLGLGLPVFILSPHIGPFAPLNRRLLLSAPAVGLELENRERAAALADTLHKLRLGGELPEMAANGWGRFAIDGFSKTAQYLVSHIAV